MNIILVAAQYAGCILGSLLLADLITGLMHWAEDTWLAPGKSTLLDRYVVADNIDHHRHPGKIRAGNYWATNRVCIALAAGAAVALLIFHVTVWEPYLILALVSQSNQVHLWAHSSQPPRVVAWLQQVGLLQSTRQHARHHKNPYASHYCTMTSYLNPVLERIRFWRAIESLVVASGAKIQRGSVARVGY